MCEEWMESAPCEMCEWNTRFALTYVHSGRKSLPDGERGAGLTAGAKAFLTGSEGPASRRAKERGAGLTASQGRGRKSLPDGELNPGLDGDSVGY